MTVAQGDIWRAQNCARQIVAALRRPSDARVRHALSVRRKTNRGFRACGRSAPADTRVAVDSPHKAGPGHAYLTTVGRADSSIRAELRAAETAVWSRPVRRGRLGRAGPVRALTDLVWCRLEQPRIRGFDLVAAPRASVTAGLPVVAVELSRRADVPAVRTPPDGKLYHVQSDGREREKSPADDSAGDFSRSPPVREPSRSPRRTPSGTRKTAEIAG